MLYAYDIVLISDSSGKLQELLNCLHEWCMKWQICINAKKSKVVHFRKIRIKKTSHLFKMDKDIIDLVQQYKYLGILLDEHLKFDLCDDLFAKSGGRALSSLISKYNVNKNFSYDIFTHLFYID